MKEATGSKIRTWSVGFVNWLDEAGGTTGEVAELDAAVVLASVLVVTELGRVAGNRYRLVRQSPHHPSRCRNTD